MDGYGKTEKEGCAGVFCLWYEVDVYPKVASMLRVRVNDYDSDCLVHDVVGPDIEILIFTVIC